MFKKSVWLIIPVFLLTIMMVFDGPGDNSIQIIKNPDQALLKKHDVFQWDTWDKEPSLFPWQFSETELVYVLKGEVHIHQEGSDKIYVLEKGDFATFKQGLRCYWDVKAPFTKHVTLEDDFLGKIYWKVAFKIQAAARFFGIPAGHPSIKKPA